jgi:hypothetical protein
MNEKILCCKRVYVNGSFRGHQCSSAGSLEHDGKHYCKKHHPPTVAEKDMARAALYDEKWKVKRDAESANQELLRKGGLFDDLIAELKAMPSYCLQSVTSLEAIIKKYEERK